MTTPCSPIEIGWSVMMAQVYNKTKKSALISGYLFHTAFNVWPFILLTNAGPGKALPTFDRTLFIVIAVIVALAAAIPVIVTKGQLGHAVEDEAEAKLHSHPAVISLSE